MTTLPLAHTTTVAALRQGDSLIVYAEGATSGFGGNLIIQRSPEAAEAPLFVIFAEAGNPGIVPGHSPDAVPTRNASVFAGQGQPGEILVEDAAGRRTVPVTQIAPGAQGDTPDLPPPTSLWNAVHDFMPPGPARLRVTGTVETPTPGYTVTLCKASPQGINPKILLLTLERRPPTGIVAQVITVVPVEYGEETDVKYTQVTILPDGFTIDVENVF